MNCRLLQAQWSKFLAVLSGIWHEYNDRVKHGAVALTGRNFDA